MSSARVHQVWEWLQWKFNTKTAYKVFYGRKNILGLEYPRPLAQFFPMRTSRPANNIYIFYAPLWNIDIWGRNFHQGILSNEDMILALAGQFKQLSHEPEKFGAVLSPTELWSHTAESRSICWAHVFPWKECHMKECYMQCGVEIKWSVLNC